MNASRALAECLVHPEKLQSESHEALTAVITAARAERLLATLAYRADGLDLPQGVQAIFRDALIESETVHRTAMWEVNRMQHALTCLNVPVILLKGSAYVAADLAAAKGRQVGDLDILVPRDRLDEVEAALLAAGWEWVKDDPYDQQYYRQWMHELPPMIHDERDGMIDVHHTILPLTARPTPDAQAMMADAIRLGNGAYILAPADMICHAAAHFAADGDMAGGMRNLWDVHILCQDFAAEGDFWPQLAARARHHGLYNAVSRTLRMANMLYGTAFAEQFVAKTPMLDRLLLRRVMARDGWGREAHVLSRFAVYVRSHWLRMPPLMLAKHLWVKWRKGDGET